NVRVVLGYTIRERDVEEYVLQQDRADGLVARAAESVLAEWLAGRSVDEALLTGRGAVREGLVVPTQQRLEDYQLGIEIQQADVAYLAPPGEVKDAFDDVTRAQTGIRTDMNKAEEFAERRLRHGQSQTYQIEQLTAAYVHEQLSKARAEAGSFDRRL